MDTTHKKKIMREFTFEHIAVGTADLESSIRWCEDIFRFAISVRDIEVFHKGLQSKKVPFVSDIIDGRVFFCEDPDGTLIRIKRA